MGEEQTLARLLHDLVPEPPREITVAQVADRVRARAPRRGTARRPRVWLAAAVAAALVVVLAVGIAMLKGSPSHVQPGPHPSSTTPSSSTPPTSAPTSASPTTAPTRSATAGPPLSGTVVLGGARMTLPGGWVARSLPGQKWPTWCLSPAAAPAVTSPDGCGLWWRQINGVPGRGFSPDAETGFDGATQYCAEGPASRRTLASGFRDLGGRSADFRRWRYECPGGRAYDIAQYVVVTAPAYVLYSGRADAAMQAAMSDLAAASVLPAQTLPLRYEVMGNVESMTHRADGYHVVLRPWTRPSDGTPAPSQFVPVPGGTAQEYVIPDRLVPDKGVTLIGLIALITDGRHVTELTIVGG